MPTLENRLNDLIRAIKEIKKQVILEKFIKAKAVQNKIDAWKTPGKKVSSKWDNVPSVEEIIQQREKTW